MLMPGTLRHIRIRKDVVEEHGEEATFLWTLRDAAVRNPAYSLTDLLDLDSRVEAHLDGLRVGGRQGWKLIQEALEGADPGAVFVAGVLAFGSGEKTQIDKVLQIGESSPDSSRGLISALGWLDYEQVGSHIKNLLASESDVDVGIGLASAVTHYSNPGDAIFAKAFASTDSFLKARALRAVGELGALGLLIATRANLKVKDPACRYWAAWSTAMLSKNKDAVACLQAFSETDNRFSERAAQTAAKCLPTREAKLWIKKLAKELSHTRMAIVAAGALGDPDLVPWLIEQMRVNDLARVAGESFSLITGCHIAYNKLDRTRPQPSATQDDVDEGLSLNADENLPWPDPVAIQKWWAEHRGDFAKETRYLLGRPVDQESLRQALKVGYQRQRIAAALELVLLSPGRPLFGTRAPAQKQIKLLG